jgi:multidrug efflux pump subunit AcrA (membrane-fusion protein)
MTLKPTLKLLLFACVLFSCKSKQEKIKPTEESITESVYASGIIKSTNQYKVFATVNGLIAGILVKEGDVIQKGDPIMKLTGTNAQLNSENAALSADYAAKSNNAEKLKELQIATNLAKSKMDEDALLQQRQQNLWNQNIGAKIDLEQHQLAYKTSISAYQSAKLRQVQLQKQIEFQAKQSQTNLRIASNTKNDYIIKSDVDGRVYQIIMKRGEMVNTLSPVAIVGDANNFLIELQVDEYDINKLEIGQKIVLSMDSYKGQVYECLVTKVNPIMNEKTKSFTIEANFIKLPKRLFPFLTCEANIIIQHKAKALTIPRAYLLEGDSVLIDKNKKVKVKTGMKDYQKVEILEGLSTNDFIYKSVE